MCAQSPPVVCVPSAALLQKISRVLVSRLIQSNRQPLTAPTHGAVLRVVT